MSALLQVQNLSVRVAGVSLLTDLSFELKKGETVALIGPNGAGKSTLLRALIGVYAESAGQMELDGKNIKNLTRLEIARQASYLPQSFQPVFDMSVDDFMALATFANEQRQRAWFPESSPSQSRIVSTDALSECGLVGFERRMLSSLSGGERQLVLIAASLCQGAKLLLFDEPATYLDPTYAERVFDVIKNLSLRHEYTVVFATHDINSALLNAARVLAIRDGKLCFDGESSGLIASGILDSLFEKRFVTVRHPTSGQELVL